MWCNGGRRLQTWSCSQVPASQPAWQMSLGIVSVHGVLSGLFGCSQRPFAGLQRSLVHSFASGGQGVIWWVWTQLPVSQPAVVHWLLSVSEHGVLSASGGCVHRPVPGLHGGSEVQSLVSGLHTVTLCVCTQFPASQPANVHRFPSVSPQVVLSGLFG